MNNQETQTHAYTVSGMSCDHCVASVSKEVARIDGVETVDVELTSGTLRVSGTNVSDAAIAVAVNEAGYEVAS